MFEKQKNLGIGLLLLGTVLAYVPALGGGFIWDDFAYVTENPKLRSLEGLVRTWIEPRTIEHQYYPVTFTVFTLEYQLWGLNPFGYHLVNALLHAFSAVFFWRLLKRLRVPGAWLAGAIFALHPVHVMSVAWVTELKNCLSGLFYLSSALLFLQFALPEEPRSNVAADATKDREENWHLYAAALFLHLCGMLSKTATCSLPVALLILLWWQKGRLQKSDFLRLCPFFAVSFVLGLVTVWVERVYMGTGAGDFGLTFMQRLLRAGQVTWLYAWNLIVPIKLMFMYPQWELNPASAVQFLPLLSIPVLVAALWAARSKLGTAPLVALLLYLVTLAPAVGIVNIYMMKFTYYADHWVYLPSLGLIALAAAALASLAGRFAKSSVNTAKALPCVVLLPLALFTWQRGHVFRNAKTVWNDTLAKNPGCWIAEQNLGVRLIREGKCEEAMAHYRRALELKPDYIRALTSLGAALARQKRFAEAVPLFERALQLGPEKQFVHYLYGLALDEEGKTKEAIREFKKVIAINPEHSEAHNRLGAIYDRKGEIEQAQEHLQMALQYNPINADAYNNNGVFWGNRGKLSTAIKFFQAALRLKPGHVEAHKNLGMIYLNQGQLPQAARQFKMALKSDPQNVDAHEMLGVVYSRLNQPGQALREFQSALAKDPTRESVRYNQAMLLIGIGKIGAAVESLEELLRKNPGHRAARLSLARLFQQQGRNAEAIRLFRKALEAEPENPEVMSRLAWLLATSREDSLRSGKEALALGEKACLLTQYQHYFALDALAAACAETGQFDRAAELAGKAELAASKAKQAAQSEQIRRRAALYRSGKPYREPGAGQ